MLYAVEKRLRIELEGVHFGQEHLTSAQRRVDDGKRFGVQSSPPALGTATRGADREG